MEKQKRLKKQLRQNQYRIDAMRWLNLLYHVTDGLTDSYFHNIHTCLKEGNLSVLDIGISEKRLEELRVESIKRCAQWRLLFMKEGGPDSWVIAIDMREDLRKAGLSLEDIGTNEEELSSLLKK